MASGSRTQTSGVASQFRFGALEVSRFQTALAVNGGVLSVEAFLPPTLSSIQRTDAITFDVTGTITVPSYVNVWGELADGTGLTVWNGTAFVGSFAAGSTTSSLSGGTQFSVVHGMSGWESTSVTLKASAVSTSGGVFSGSAVFTISNPPTAPTIAFTPAGGGIMRRSSVLIDVVDDDGAAAIAYVMIVAALSDGITVPVFSGTLSSYSFGSQVDSASTRTSITNGLQHAIVCNAPGWNAASITLGVTAIDTGGRMSTASATFAITDVPHMREIDLARRRKVYPIMRQRPRLTTSLT